MSNVPAFIERLRIIAKALEESEPHAKQRAILGLRAAADRIELQAKPVAEEPQALRADAMRYRWLRNRAWGVPIENSLAYAIEFPTFTRIWSGDMKDFSNIDAAIDAALAASSGDAT